MPSMDVLSALYYLILNHIAALPLVRRHLVKNNLTDSNFVGKYKHVLESTQLAK